MDVDIAWPLFIEARYSLRAGIDIQSAPAKIIIKEIGIRVAPRMVRSDINVEPIALARHKADQHGIYGALAPKYLGVGFLWKSICQFHVAIALLQKNRPHCNASSGSGSTASACAQAARAYSPRSRRAE